MSSADPGPAACLLPRLEYKVLIAIGRAAGTLNVAALAVALFRVGTQFPSARAAARPESSPAPPFRVEATPVVLQPDHEVTAAFTGRLEAPRSTNLGLETGCTLAEIMTEEGEAVPAGAVLARVDVRALQVDRAGLAAALCGKLLLRHGFSCAIRKSGFSPGVRTEIQRIEISLRLCSQSPMIGRPMSGDPLKNLQYLLRLTRTIYSVADLAHPFAVDAQLNQPCTTFHAVVAGQCHLDLPGTCPISLKAGHFVLLPRGGEAYLLSSPKLQRTSVNAPPIKKLRENLFLLRNSGDGDRTIVISCAVRFEHPDAQRLVRLMEPVIHFEASKSQYEDCINRTLNQMSTLVRVHKPGDDILLMHLSDALLNETIHTSILRNLKGQTGWLAALGDRQIGVAVDLLHDAPERDWTLASLSIAARMSRTVFAERFAEIVGEPPMRYLARLRMDRALTMLSSGNDNIGVIAHRLGYASEASFSRAFRRIVGVPPSSVRRSPDEPKG